MAIVKLLSEEVERPTLLPNLCMYCGVPSTCHVTRTFEKGSRGSNASYDALVTLISIVVSAAMRAAFPYRALTLQIPCCDKHKNYWKRHQVVLLIFLIPMMAGVMLSSVWALLTMPPDPIRPRLLAVLAFLVGLMVVGLVGFKTTPIYVVRIEEDGIILGAVCQPFAAALDKRRILGKR